MSEAEASNWEIAQFVLGIVLKCALFGVALGLSARLIYIAVSGGCG
jgi:hypothetical protein